MKERERLREIFGGISGVTSMGNGEAGGEGGILAMPPLKRNLPHKNFGDLPTIALAKQRSSPRRKL